MDKRKLVLLLLLGFFVVSLVSNFAGVQIPHVKAQGTTTETFTSSTYDGFCSRSTTNYNGTWNSTSGNAQDSLDTSMVGQWYVGGAYFIYRAFFFFDTSSLADDVTITDVKLSIRIFLDNSDTDFNITLQNGQPFYPHQPIVNQDYYYAYYSGDGGQFNTSGLGAGYNNITLNTQGQSWINVEDVTKLCVRSSRDITPISPTGEEDIIFYSLEKGVTYAPKLYVTYEIPSYTFHGLYDESTGLLKGESERAVDVTAWYEGETYSTFEVNGTYMFNTTTVPLYFHFELGARDREYWLSEEEVNIDIYIFNATLTTYTIVFLDLAGILNDNPIVEAQHLINGTLMTVEKRKVDEEKKLYFSLVQGSKYTIIIQNGESYTFGDLLMTSQTTIQLTLKGIEFPKETLLTYKYVRIYGIRGFDTPNGTITITYEDTLNLTASVTIYINYKNGTNIYNATETTNSFNHEWANAMNDTDYRVLCTIDHATYGVYNWRQYFPLHLSTMPWGLGFFGTLPFNTAYIIPAILILFAGGCFSQINAYAGAFSMVIVAIIMAYMGWLPIPAGPLIVAFTLAILMGIIYAKRRVLT